MLEWSGGAPPEPYFKEDEFTQRWGRIGGCHSIAGTKCETGILIGAAARAGREKYFPCFSHRSRARLLPHLRIPLATARNEEFWLLSWEEMRERTGGRIPHFAPRDDSTWENCEANRREGEEYLRVVLEESGDTRVVGEDLGTVPDYVRQVCAR